MTTKERIVWEALDLFSQRGYGAVSVRDIAGAVGIRESSLYNHFGGKRQIFDAIVDICCQKAEEYYHSHGLPFAGGEDISAFRERGGGTQDENILLVFRYFFEDPWNVRFRKLLTVSQFEDERAGELYRRLYCMYPVQVQTAVFSGLVDAGELSGDPERLAAEFYGVVFLLLNCCGSWQEVEPRLREHIEDFRRIHGGKGPGAI